MTGSTSHRRSTVGVFNALSLCWHYGLQRAKMDMAYRADFWINATVSLLHLCVQLFFLWAIFYRIDAIQGWTFEEVVLIFAFNRISFGYFSMFCFESMTRFSDFYVIEGNLDRPLLRPMNPLLQVIMENVSFRYITVVITGTAIAVWAFLNVEPAIPVTVGTVLAMHGLGLLGAVVYTGVFLVLASASFWIKDRVGLVNPLFSISEASRYPLTIYHPAVQIFFSLVVPFGFCAFYPATYFTDPQAWSGWLLAGPLIAAATVAAGVFVFYRGLRVYESTGS